MPATIILLERCSLKAMHIIVIMMMTTMMSRMRSIASLVIMGTGDLPCAFAHSVGPPDSPKRPGDLVYVYRVMRQRSRVAGGGGRLTRKAMWTGPGSVLSVEGSIPWINMFSPWV